MTLSVVERLVGAALSWVPRPLVGRVARTYVAGETLDEALDTARELEREGCRVTFDLLGEFISRMEEADRRVVGYLDILDRIQDEGLPANVSVKLTAFGLLLDEEGACANLRRVVARARDYGNFVRIDMEDSPCHAATFRIYRRLRGMGFDNLGLVLQARMRSGLDDIRRLSDLRPNYRLCKGIYVEPEEIAFQDFQEIRDNYMAMLKAMLDGGSYVGIATHDTWLVERSLELLRERGLGRDDYEFQMLLGVRPELRRKLVGEGHALRVYVPFGRDWYAYSVRRLKENPAIALHVIRAMFR